MGMKIYIASGFDNRQYINEVIVPMLKEEGHEVTSRWLLDNHGVEGKVIHQAQYAHIDLEDIKAADLIIALNPSTSTKGGTYFELGCSWAMNKRVIIIGSLSGTVFESLFSHWDTLEEVLSILD